MTRSSKKDLTDYLDDDLSHDSSAGVKTISSRGIAEHSSEIYGLHGLFSNTKKRSTYALADKKV